MDNSSEVEKRIRECHEQQALGLDLRDLALLQVPEAVFSLKHLRELWLDHNKLNTLPNAIINLHALQTLSLNYNQLSTLPDAITQLHNLEDIRLNNNQFSTLPESITQLQALQTLSLDNNQLRTLPESITQLQALQTLYLANNQLRTLPESITKLQALQELWLNNNQLRTLPESISQLQALQTLYLANNQLRTLPESITKLQALQVLSLSNNQLSTLPESITKLQALQRLYLANNQLSTLPESITQLQALQTLSLANNQLRTLPESITKLQALQELYLNNNRLSTLPESISQLQALQWLSLANNQLSTLPESITQLKALQTLYLDNNPLLNPPLEVASRGIEAIRTYFAQFGEFDHLYEVKLLLVGEGEVGKSSLKKALTLPGFALHKGEKSTEGIDIQPWVLPGNELGLAHDLRLNLWDFGGQEIYHATHQFFLTRRSLYLLVTESRKEDQREDFYYWLNIISLLGDRSPVILVLNKIDERRKDLPIHQLQQDFANLVDYQAVSCAAGYEATIVALKAAIWRALGDPQRMNHLRAPLPAVWVTIREELAELLGNGHKHLANSEYLERCARYGLDETVANVLSDYFHDLGVFLHFREDLALADTIFLDHAWVTDAVYKVLDDEEVKLRYGKFNDQDLRKLWSSPATRNLRPELRALMEKFELCYRLPNGGYLSPQLLPVDEPNALPWRSDQDNLRFDYRYGFMPKGLLSRFIVRRHQDIYEQTHWRYGVVLEWGNCRALVREELLQKRIRIVLEGGNKKGFLEIIRKTMEEIHATFNRLAVEEMIPCHCAQCQSRSAPHFYRYTLLNHYLQGGRAKIICDNSLQEVNIHTLINDVILPPKRHEDDDELGFKREYHIHGNYVEQRIATEGGAAVTGCVSTEGGDFIGRDQSV